VQAVVKTPPGWHSGSQSGILPRQTPCADLGHAASLNQPLTDEQQAGAGQFGKGIEFLKVWLLSPFNTEGSSKEAWQAKARESMHWKPKLTSSIKVADDVVYTKQFLVIGLSNLS
jgi:hypothetical protein